MNKTRTTLMTQFATIIIGVLIVAALFETGVLEEGLMAGNDGLDEFVATAVMELLTIALIPTALRLFKFKRVERELQEQHETALQKWGVLRMALLELPLMANTLLYYIYLNTSFGYMAIIVLLCMAFVYPSKERCEAEAFLQEPDKA